MRPHLYVWGYSLMPVGFLSLRREPFSFNGPEKEIQTDMDACKGFCEEQVKGELTYER